MATPVNEVGPSVSNCAKAGEDRHLVLDGLQRFQFGHDFVVAACFAGNPASAASRCVCQPQPPEISAEPDWQHRSVGEGRAIAIEETVEERKTHADSRAIDHAAQERAAIYS